MSQPAAVHVLNGDALAARFPESLTGQKLVVREMLMEGPLEPVANAAFWQLRENYLKQAYPQVKLAYAAHVRPAFEQLTALTAHTPVNLWFEYDLFCQVNFWFCCSLLAAGPEKKVAFVAPLPQEMRWQGFGSHAAADLLDAYRHRQPLPKNQLNQLASLWRAYANRQYSKMEEIVAELQPALPFLKETLETVRNFHAGRVEQHLRHLRKEHPEAGFTEIFEKFSATEGRFGLGDLQLKRILHRLK